MKRSIIIIAASVLALAMGTATAQDDAASMSELLRLIEQGQARDNQDARRREAEFQQQKSQQQQLLNRARAERTRQENQSARLEQLFEDNQTKIVAARIALEDGSTRDYNVLRIGRVGLYFQSDDTRITGRWSMEEKKWVIDNSARNEIRKGIRMAKQLIAPELILIPIPAATAAGAS